jgi:hypothetical protein
MKGKLPADLKLKLEVLAKYLGVNVPEHLLHTAKGDTHLCVASLEVLLTL